MKKIELFLSIFILFIFSWNPNFMHGYIVGPDEGQHLAWINEMLHGKVLYKDIYMFYGPLLEFMPIMFMKMVGVSLANFRLFYVLSKIFTLIAAFLILHLVLKRRAFLYLSLLILVVTQVSDFWSTRWGGPRLVFGLAALYFLILYFQTQNRPWLFTAGISSGISFFTSHEVGIFIIAASIASIIVFAVQGSKNIDIKRYVALILYYILGFLIIAFPIILYLIIKGAFTDYIKIMFWDLPFKYSKVFGQSGFNLVLFKNLSSIFRNPFHFISYYSIKFLIVVAIYLIGVIYIVFFYGFRVKDKNNIVILLIIFSGVPLLVTNLRQVIGEQSALYFPLGIILGFILLEQLLALLDKKPAYSNPKKVIVFCLNSALILFFSSYAFMESTTQARIINTSMSYFMYKKPVERRLGEFIDGHHATMQEQNSRFYGDWGKLNLERAKGIYLPIDQAKIITEVVDFIQKNTTSSDNILVFPHEGQYHFLTDRASPTRFTPIIYAAIDENYQKIAIADLEKAKLRYIVYVRDAFIFTDYNKIPNEKRLNLVFDYIVKNYYIIRQYGETFILAKK